MSKCDQKLLARLIKTNARYIDPLVDIITDYGNGRFALNSSIKNKLIEAKNSLKDNRYDEYLLSLLIKELQEFGGHSAVNVARRLIGYDLISYEKIVADVFKKLNGQNAKNKNLIEKEKEIALALFGENWLILPFKERHERSISSKVLLGQFKISDALSINNSTGAIAGLTAAASAALFTSARALGGTAALGLTVNSTMSESYRITIPFVAQMGWISLQERQI